MKSPPILPCVQGPLPSGTADAMNLMAREGQLRDIPEWQALHCSLGIPYSKAEWCALPAMWHELLASARLKLFLVEDRTKSSGARIVSCCAAVFVTDEFCQELRSAITPFLSIRLVRCYLAGELPILTRTEIARANDRDGLNLVLCFEGPERGTLSGERYLPLREKRHEAFQLAMSGYQIKEFLVNPIGELAYEETIDAGAKLRCDFSHLERGSNGWTKNLSQPRLVGLTRKEAEAHPGSQLAGLFVYIPPRFHFSRSEQSLLQHALTGETCEDLATSLSLSPWTVKKRWHTIYERVTATDDSLLPAPIPNGARAHARGAERRRRLLNYLRQHPEELRPVPLRKS
jgi:DNA-binding NarL/FixJ family response regulator